MAHVYAAFTWAAGPALLYLAMVDRRLRRSAALITAILLASSPGHVAHSILVKQYTVEATLTIGLLWCTWTILEEGPTHARWLRLLLVACIGFVLSASIVPVIAVTIAVAGWRVWKVATDIRWFSLTAAGAAAFSLTWTWLILLPRRNDLLRDYWAASYVTTDAGLGQALESIYERSRALTTGLTTVEPKVALAILAVGAGVAFRRRFAMGLLLLGPFLVAVALAVLHVAPLGGGRTDIYLYPTLLLVVGVAVDTVADRIPQRARPPMLVAMLLVGLVGTFDVRPPTYPAEDLRPLVEELEARQRPGDKVLIYPVSNFAFSLYTSSPVEIIPSSHYATGWEIEVRDPDVTVLPNHRSDPTQYAPLVAAATESTDRVWLIGSHFNSDFGSLEQILRDQAFSMAEQITREGAVLELWTRADPGAANDDG